ncbi:MAG: GNAT family N-acetyltransferase, partial [Hyphococcus sp.]
MDASGLVARVREVGKGDRANVLKVVRDAFNNDAEARLVETLWADQSITAERLLDSDNRVIAYAAVSPVTIAGDADSPYDALGLAPVAVAPDRQRQGYGTAVVDAAIAAAFKRFPDRLLFVLGEPAYYARFGFMPAGPLGYQWEGG